jgi:hypothetical protein
MSEKKTAQDILKFLANENDEVEITHATTVLSMAICSLAVQYGLPKERLLIGMSMAYDAYKAELEIPENTQCH